MKFINKPILFSAVVAAIMSSCGGGSDILSTPIANIDTTPIKEQELTKAQKENWGHLDLVKDTIPGMSVDKAYAEIIKGKPGKKIIVAVIDSGIDITHEDLDGKLWTNKDEIPGNGIDDDKNGYIDDIHGWNFLGTSYDEHLEYVRIVATGDESFPRFAEAKEKLEKERAQVGPTKTRYEQIYSSLKDADAAFTKQFGTKDYTPEQVEALKTTDEKLVQYKSVAAQMKSYGLASVQDAKETLNGEITKLAKSLNTSLNPEHKYRSTGDNPDDFNDKPGYGDANVGPVIKSEAHGTHVAGIILAERNNGKGANGVVANAELMSVRVVPNGDEYDKDVALAIRYAVDNGAKVINTSFGKYYSPHSDWVRDAIAYAGQKDVLIVNAAGNEGIDLDKKDVYPNDAIGTGLEVANNFITVGSLDPVYGSKMVSGFSNYGKINVDVFAPGEDIYSTFPENEYESIGGTSMASPAVAGIAALIRSQYPNLTATQVKQIIVDSGLPLTTKVIVGGDANNVQSFNVLSKSGRIANAYNALIMAEKISKNIQ